MKKGFIFSFDAANAIVLVIIMIGLVSFYYSVQENTASAQRAIDNEIYDSAITGLYMNKTAGDFGLYTLDEIDLQTEQYGCTVTRIFDLYADRDRTAQSEFAEEKTFCKVIG